MEKQNDQIRFSTIHELRFIKNIGLDKFGSLVFPDRKKLLKNYIKASEKRSDWGNIDKDTAISTAENLLNEVQ